MDINLSKLGRIAQKGISGAVIDSIVKLNIRISHSQDLRINQTDPSYAQTVAAHERFMALLENNPAVLRREVVNYPALGLEDKNSSWYMPDERTNLHLSRLYLLANGVESLCNLACPDIGRYLKNPLSGLYRELFHRPLETLSLHLGFAAEALLQDKFDGHSFPRDPVILEEFQVKQRVLKCLFDLKTNLLQWEFKGDLMVEVLDYQTDERFGRKLSAGEYVTEPEFVDSVLRRSGYKLLLDVAHLLITAGNKGYNDPLEYVEQMMGWRGRNSLREIHLAMPEESGGRWRDLHRPIEYNLESPVAGKFYMILSYLLEKRVPGKPLTINLETPIATVDRDAWLLILFLREKFGF